MRVLFVISSLNTGGAQRALSNVVTGLPDDFEIDILLNTADNITYPYTGNIIDLGFKDTVNRNSVFYQLRVLVRRLRVLRKLKRENSYTVCVSFLESANIANILTGRKHCKTIVSVRCYLNYQKSFVNKCMTLAVKRLYNRADLVTALSKGVERDLVRSLNVHKEKAITIYNGFDLENIRSLAGTRPAKPGSDKAFIFITAGRCEQQKGQWHLIRSFAHLIRNHSNCLLIILGEGPYVEYYKQLICAYGIDDKVLLKGFVDNPYSEYISADVFVFPSLYEGFGNVVLEAMICGLPVISTDYRYGAREILAPGTDIEYELTAAVEQAEYGIMTPVCSGNKHSAGVPLEPQEQFLLEAMELIYTDETVRERYRAASQKRAENFSIEKCVEQWKMVIEQ